MEYREASLPRELIYSVAKMNARRNRVVVAPSTQNTFTSGSGLNLTFQLPDRSVIDLSSASIGGFFKLTCQTGASNVQYVFPASHQLVAENRLIINGSQVLSGGSDQYSHISQHLFYKAQTNEEYRNSHILEGQHFLFKPVDLQTGNVPVFGGNIATNATESEGKWLVYNNLPCAKTSRFLDTSIFGKSYISIRPTNNNILKANHIQARNVQWTWQNLELSVDIISEIPELYVETVRQLVAQKKQLKMVVANPFTNVYSFNNSVNLNVNSQSADGFMLAPIQNNGITAYYSDIANLEAPCFTFGWGANSSFNSTISLGLRVGNYQIPQTGNYQRLWQLANQTVESLFGDSIFAQNSLYISDVATTLPYHPAVSEAGYCQQNAVWYQNLCMLMSPGWQHPDAILSGVNTMGIDQVFNINTAPDPTITTANLQLFLGCICSATAVFDSETGSVSVIN